MKLYRRVYHITTERQENAVLEGTADNAFMSVYMLIGRRVERPSLVLHHIKRTSSTTCPHDHPWSFWTLILKGGYVEEVTRKDGTIKRRRRWPGMLLWRPAKHTHAIVELPKGSCWTLVLEFKKTREWGYHTKEGWVHFQEFYAKTKQKAELWCKRLGE